MNLFAKLRALFGGRRLRNKAGGMAWIKPHSQGSGAEAIYGQVVKTVCLEDGYFWVLDPPPKYVARKSIRFLISGGFAQEGQTVQVRGLADDVLVPIPDSGVTEAEVRELFMPRPVTSKESA